MYRYKLYPTVKESKKCIENISLNKKTWVVCKTKNLKMEKYIKNKIVIEEEIGNNDNIIYTSFKPIPQKKVRDISVKINKPKKEITIIKEEKEPEEKKIKEKEIETLNFDLSKYKLDEKELFNNFLDKYMLNLDIL